jgi:glutamate racemase
MPNNSPIGIFDSGVGGLTVARAIRDALPNESLVYFGDTLHLPYGEKSSASIQRYSHHITEFLISKDCKAIVIACNSASAHAYSTVRELYPSELPVFNVIDPMVNYVKENCASDTIGIIGTKATIRSQVYRNRLKPLKSASLETPLLAAMVEEGFVNNEISRLVLSEYLNRPELSGISALILGCTHYPLLSTDIEKHFDGKVKVLNSGQVVADQLKKTLHETELFAESNHSPQDQFFVSDYTPFFEKTTALFFGREIHLEELKVT